MPYLFDGMPHTEKLVRARPESSDEWFWRNLTRVLRHERPGSVTARDPLDIEAVLPRRGSKYPRLGLVIGLEGTLGIYFWGGGGRVVYFDGCPAGKTLAIREVEAAAPVEPRVV